MLKDNFFILSLLVAVAVGIFWRQPAYALAEWRHYLLFAVMLMLGMEQRLFALLAQLKKIPASLLSLFLSFGVFPVLAWCWAQLFFDETAAIAGFVVLGAVPTTLTSAVIYTRLDQGNSRLALLIVLFSQILCVVLTPLLLSMMLGASVELPMAQMMRQLLVYFLLPLALGMLIGRALPMERIAPYLTRPEQFVVALFVFMGSAHIPSDTPLLTIAKTIWVVLGLQMIFVVLVRLVIKRFPAMDQTALFYTSTQKTLSVGLYLLLSYFPPAAFLPMVLYHLLQLTVGKFYWRPEEGV